MQDGLTVRCSLSIPRRVAVLLIGGDKTGNNRWYEEFVPRADKIYAEHLKQIAEEGNR